MRVKRYANVVGFDDSPFPSAYSGKVKVVGAVFASLRFEGVMIGEIEKDGSDAARRLTQLVKTSKFSEHIQLIMLQGIAMAGFNVVDVFYLNSRLGLPVMVVSRVAPDLNSIKKALLTRIAAGEKKWAIIEKLGPMEPIGGVYVQRLDITARQAAAVVARLAVHSRVPEPIRTAHLIAGAIGTGISRGAV